MSAALKVRECGVCGPCHSSIQFTSVAPAQSKGPMIKDRKLLQSESSHSSFGSCSARRIFSWRRLTQSLAYGRKPLTWGMCSFPFPGKREPMVVQIHMEQTKDPVMVLFQVHVNSPALPFFSLKSPGLCGHSAECHVCPLH